MAGATKPQQQTVAALEHAIAKLVASRSSATVITATYHHGPPARQTAASPPVELACAN